MAEGRNWGSTVLGWFVVAEPGDPSPAHDPSGEAAASATAGSPGESLATPPAFVTTPPPPAPDGRVDFEAVFEAAGVDADERGHVRKANELLESLPTETPLAVRKQIVEASLKAFGVPVEKIIEGGVQEVQALEGYIRAGAADTQALLSESATRIEDLQTEIKNLRTVMEQRVAEQQAVTAACNAKKLDVQRVLEFFGQEAVARVVRDSPKLVDPAAPDATSTKEG